MKIFSKILATFERDVMTWLPPVEELEHFMKQLSEHDISSSEENGEVSVCGSLEAILSIKASLSEILQKTTKPDEVSECDSSDLDNSHENLKKETLNLQKDYLSTAEQEDSSNECLNIEVLHPKFQEKTSEKLFKFCCGLCSFKSQRESHYKRHLNLHETASTIYYCEDCNFSTLRFTHLRRHQVIHSAKAMMCPSCDYSTDDAKLLVRHKRLKHKAVPSREEETQVIRQCPNCTYQTTRLYLFERHLKVHSAEESKGGPNLFICSQCDYRTTRKIHYVRHVRDVHRQWRPYLCNFCGKAFKRPDALKQHNLLHATPGEDGESCPFKCDICNKICHSRAHLKEHQSVHSMERSFLCEICGASFKTRSVQRKHVANLHQNPRAFSCSHCSKRFNTNYALRRHMKQHPSIPETEGINQVTVVMPIEHSTINGSITVPMKVDQQDGSLLFAEQ